MVDRADAMAAPIDPLAGLVTEGDLEGVAVAGFRAVGSAEDMTVAPLKVMVGSSVIMDSSRPAHPSCWSTAFGSNTPSRTYFPLTY